MQCLLISGENHITFLLTETTCEKKRAKILGLIDPNRRRPIADRNPLVCDENGLFKQRQCNGYPRFCFCVNPSSGKNRFPGFVIPISEPFDCASKFTKSIFSIVFTNLYILQ